MSIAFVKKAHATSDAGANSITATFGSSTAVGNTVTGFVSWFNSGGSTADLTSITDGTNTYSIVDTNGSTAEIFSASFVGKQTGSATAIVAHFSSTNPSFFRMFVQEYSGSSGTVNVHTKNRQASPGTATDAITTGAVTTTVNGCMIVGCAIDLTNTNTPNPGTSYTSRDTLFNAGDQDCQIVEDQLQTSAGSIAATFTSTVGNTSTYYNYLLALAPSGGAIAALASALNQYQ